MGASPSFCYESMTMKIAILDDYQDSVRNLKCFDLLREHDVKVFHHSARGVGQLATRLQEFEVLVLIRERTSLRAPLLAKLPHLKLISQTGKLSGHVDVLACTQHGIAIAEGVGDPTAPAELTWALIMAAMRKIPQYTALLRQGVWQTASTQYAHNNLGRTLKGKTLGIWGYGKIGKMVAGYGKAFGMQVLIWGSEQSRKNAEADGYQAAESRTEFFEKADVLSLHLRLHEATRGIVTRADLALMKPDSLFVNSSRSELVEDGALMAALREGRPGLAALDVYDIEPLPADSALLRMDNVVATPHLGYVEQNSYETYFRAAFENIVNFANGKPSNILNPAYVENRGR